MDIQKARFTERLTLIMEVDKTCLNIQIPALTLQPIIENAVIHAVEPKEDGGIIWLRIKEVDDKVRIEIEDDGMGMTEEKIAQILDENYVQTEGHSTGIGFSNVVKRLRLFYGLDDVIEIESCINGGTKIVLKIPKAKGESSDEAFNCG